MSEATPNGALAEVLAIVRDDLDAIDGVAIPPFAAVLARARVEGVVGLPDDAEPVAHALDRMDDGAVLAAARFGDIDDFVAAARSFAGEQHVAAIPPMRRTTRRTRTIVAVTLLATAAALVLVIGALLQRVGAPTLDRRDRAEPSSAPDHAVAPPREGVAAPRSPAPAPAPAPSVAPIAAPTIEAPPVRPSPASVRTDDLAALDAEARAAWQRGDVARAQALLERLVRQAKRRSIADVAYGDLFALARQRGQSGKLRAYWRAYVRRFPSGRFIDDARAGLCRSASGDDARACWSAYLRDRPQGTYRDHARAIVAGGGRDVP